MKPYCFVLMPFGEKLDEAGNTIDFDQIYMDIIRPSIEKADLIPIRADEELQGGFIHKRMFERLMLCDYAVADVTTANPNVLYELGIRHAIRPYTTVLTFRKGPRLPFDISPLRAVPYNLDKYGKPKEAASDQKIITEKLIDCRNKEIDSPLHQLIEGFPCLEVSHLKTDSFREIAKYCNEMKQKIRKACEIGSTALKEIEQELNIKDEDPVIIVDLYLSYRYVEDVEAMIDLVNKMPPELANTVMVKEQMGFALNRNNEHDEAERVLMEVINDYGPSTETYGLLGRVYKDKWLKAKEEGNEMIAKGHLDKAIETYLKGYEVDMRDAYPGINAITLMEISGEYEEKKNEIVPVVNYAVKRRLQNKAPDYWDYATYLELKIIDKDKEAAEEYLKKTLANIRAKWEPKSTVKNINLIIQAREKRKEGVGWMRDIKKELERAIT